MFDTMFEMCLNLYELLFLAWKSHICKSAREVLSKILENKSSGLMYQWSILSSGYWFYRIQDLPIFSTT